MNHRILRGRTAPLLALAAVLLLAAPGYIHAQRGGGAPQTPQQAAPINLTGYWVSVVTEDWRFRMVTPQKGNYESVPLNAEGRRVADTWDPAKDEAAGNECKAYGAPGLMRLPGRLHITWENPNTLRLGTDAGTQTRLFHFGSPQPLGGDRTRQGFSVAEWEYANVGRGQPRKGSLKVVTTNMQPGYLRKNGVPYSENLLMREYYDIITAPNGAQWLIISAVINDPMYMNVPFLLSTNFRREPDGSKWNPTPCTAK